MRLQLHHCYEDGTTDLVATLDLDREPDLDNRPEILFWMHRQMHLHPPPADACWKVCREDDRSPLHLHQGPRR